MQCHSCVLFQLGPDLLANLSRNCVAVGQVEFLYEVESKLIGGYQRFVEIPQKSIFQPVRNGEFLLSVEGIGVVVLGSAHGRCRDEGGYIDVETDGDQRQGEAGLSVVRNV